MTEENEQNQAQDTIKRRYVGPFVVTERPNPTLGSTTITAERVIHGERLAGKVEVHDRGLTLESDERVKRNATDVLLNDMNRGVFNRAGSPFPYLPLDETSQEDFLTWLKRFHLPCRIWGGPNVHEWADRDERIYRKHLVFEPDRINIVDADGRPMLTIPLPDTMESLNVARGIAAVINALPVLLLARE